MKVVTLNSIVAVIRARRGYKGFLHKFIEECEIVDAIPIPDNATNGDMIKAMFPDVVNSGMDLVDAFNNAKRWWNAPYKKEVEECTKTQ